MNTLIIVTACQQCKRTLQGGARSLKVRIKVMDITEMVYGLAHSSKA